MRNHLIGLHKMFTTKFSRKVLVTALVGCSLTAVANEQLKPVIDSASKINQSAQKSQTKIDKIADTMQGRLQQFKTVNKEIDGLTIYNKQLEKQIANQLLEMENINVSIDQVSVIERQITPLMLKMITSLEQFVALDVPFLPKERANRLASLKELMDRADVASSEKFRRVLEAYQIEVDYGRTIESYTGLIDVDGQEREVDFLRIGRLDLIYLTKDGKKAGIWNTEASNFERLPDSNISQINKAIRIAKKQLAPDMLTLPVKAV
jgi:TolA-binding protein